MTNAVRTLSDLVGEPDRTHLTQDKLDLTRRVRTSKFPWRGQFSPDLIAHLLSANAEHEAVVLDPFAGSGTTLFEAMSLGYDAVAGEVNPAACWFSAVASCASVESATRQRELADVSAWVASIEATNPFMSGDQTPNVAAEAAQFFSELQEPRPRAVLAAAVMLAMGHRDVLEPLRLAGAYRRVEAIVLKLRRTQATARVFLADARELPIDEASVDLVLTSPPYINVFNYHQNYRKAVELLGGKPLEFAQSEIGANRKHRGNRFLTVIQYAIDMSLTFAEFKRVMTRDGRIVLVVGRESNVRGVPFRNAEILAECATRLGFRLIRRQERRFTNRFGESIWEEILTMEPPVALVDNPTAVGRAVGLLALNHAQSSPATASDIEAAIARAVAVAPSPILATPRQVI